jgi:hypothetical protein
MNLPNWQEIHEKDDSERSALEKFIYGNEPAGEDENLFRTMLEDVLREEIIRAEVYLKALKVDAETVVEEIKKYLRLYQENK